jgi:hypothetical protein
MKPVEQVSEVKTSKLGAILLTLMVIFIFSISQTFLSDISSIINFPAKPSSCIEQLVNTKEFNLNKDICRENTSYQIYYDNQDSNEFQFNKTDIQYNLESLYDKAISELQPVFSVNNQINTQENILREQRQNLADQDPTLEPIEIKNQKQIIQDLKTELSLEYKKVKPTLDLLKSEYQAVEKKINFQEFFYLLGEFILHLIFILPFFIFGLRKYFQLKKSNSPFTVIATAVAVAASILLLQVVLGFLFRALPWDFLYRIWSWLENFQFLKYVFYYGVVLATIGLFGGVVYYIQKNTYAPEKVAKRRILKGQCPRCESRIRDSYNNCRGCGLALKQTCPNCKHKTSKFFKFCSNCGHNLTKK